VDVSSSDTRVGTIMTSPVVFNGGDQSKPTSFHPLASGATVITVGVPPGFTAASAQRQVLATVSTPGIRLSSPSVGRNLQSQASVFLSAPAPRGLTLTIASTDPSKLLVSSSPRTAGAGSISMSLSAGSSDFSFWVQGLDSNGTVQLTASAPGFNGGSVDVPLYPSGFGFSFVGASVNLSRSFSQFFSVGPLLLDPQSLVPIPSASPQIRAGMPAITVDVTSSDPAVASVVGPSLTFNGGDSQSGVQVRGVAPGTATLSVSVPSGFSEPASSRQVTATVR
jgi:hypothetical protein